jgi:hypothetical protein
MEWLFRVVALCAEMPGPLDHARQSSNELSGKRNARTPFGAGDSDYRSHLDEY